MTPKASRLGRPYQLATGRNLRILTVVDTFSWFSPAIDPRFSYRGEDVVRALERICGEVGYPNAILRCVNAEFATVVSATGTTTAKDWLLPILDRVLATRSGLNERAFTFGEACEHRAVVSAFPVRGSGKAKGGIGVFVLETTEQQRTMAALGEASGQLAAIGDNIPQLAWMAEPTGAIGWHKGRTVRP